MAVLWVVLGMYSIIQSVRPWSWRQVPALGNSGTDKRAAEGLQEKGRGAPKIKFIAMVEISIDIGNLMLELSLVLT